MAAGLFWIALGMVAADRGPEGAPRPDFGRDIVPILTRLGCNAGACHGKATGQNGFRLSLFGGDPAADYEAIAREGRGRRVFPGRPERSLFLRKPTGRVPHGGGVHWPSIRPNTGPVRWVEDGAKGAGTGRRRSLPTAGSSWNRSGACWRPASRCGPGPWSVVQERRTATC